MNYIDEAISICDKKMYIYTYEADKYYNYGKEQKFVEHIKFLSDFYDKESARKEQQRKIGNQMSLKNVRLVSKELI